VTPLRSVYFDCDSTLASIEGVDELLRHLDAAARADILALTRQAMEGTMPLAEVYETRLARVAPDRSMLAAVGKAYIAACVPDAGEVLAALRFLGLHVGIISGGLLEPVRVLGHHLGVDEANIHAVPLLFDADGHYLDFDHTSPLWRNGGKVDVIRALPADHHPMAFVGDGITDLETAPVVERFVGFGGVESRSAVREAAQYWVDAPSLAPVLLHCITEAQGQQLQREPRFAALLQRARAPSCN